MKKQDEKKVQEFLARRIEFQRQIIADLNGDEEAWDSEPEDEPGAHHVAFLLQELEVLGLDLLLEGIKRFERMDDYRLYCGESNDLSLLALTLAKQGRRDEARRVANEVSEHSFSSQMEVIVNIALVTHAKEDVEYACKQAELQDTLSCVETLIRLTQVREYYVRFSRMARVILGPLYLKGTDRERVTRSLVELARHTQYEPDLLFAVDALNHPKLDNGTVLGSPGCHLLFSSAIVRVKDLTIAKRVIERVRDLEWRRHYFQIINNKRLDLN